MRFLSCAKNVLAQWKNFHMIHIIDQIRIMPGNLGSAPNVVGLAYLVIPPRRIALNVMDRVHVPTVEDIMSVSGQSFHTIYRIGGACAGKLGEIFPQTMLA